MILCKSFNGRNVFCFMTIVDQYRTNVVIVIRFSGFFLSLSGFVCCFAFLYLFWINKSLPFSLCLISFEIPIKQIRKDSNRAKWLEAQKKKQQQSLLRTVRKDTIHDNIVSTVLCCALNMEIYSSLCLVTIWYWKQLKTDTKKTNWWNTSIESHSHWYDDEEEAPASSHSHSLM